MQPPRPSLLIIFCFVAVVAGCDSQENATAPGTPQNDPNSPDDPTSPEALADYFPLAPGQEWVFDYRGGGETGIPRGGYQDMGTMTLTFFRSPSSCNDCEGEYPVMEEFVGERSSLQETCGKYCFEWGPFEPYSFAFQSTVTESENQIRSIFSGNNPIPRYAEPSSPEILTFTGTSPSNRDYTLRLKRNVGPIYYYESFISTHSNSFKELIRR